MIMVESEGIAESVRTWRTDAPAKFVQDYLMRYRLRQARSCAIERPDMLWPLGVYVAVVMALVTSMLVLSWLLGQ